MIVDDRFYLMTRETERDVSVQIRRDGNKRYAKNVEVHGAALACATSLGYTGEACARVAEGIVVAMREGLNAEGVEVRR